MITKLLILFFVSLVVLLLARRYFLRKHDINHRNKKPFVQQTTKLSDDPDVILGLRCPDIIEKKVQQTATLSQSAQHEVLQDIKPQIISLCVLAAPDDLFKGYELMQTLLSLGLRFGKMQIFHRHEHEDGRGKILFSVVSAVEPGYFDITNIGGLTCPGVTFFMSLSQLMNPSRVLDLMLDAANELAEQLGGVVCDAKRQILTAAMVQQLRQRVSYYEQEQQTLDLFV